MTEAKRAAHRRYLQTEHGRKNHAALARAWRKKNPDKIRNLNQSYYERTAEQQRETARKWREENREKSREYQRRYRAANPLPGILHSNEQRARRAHGFASGANRNFVKQFYITARRISRCTGIRFCVDHIMPLSKGGLHHESNLQVLSHGKNARKFNLVPDECKI